MKIIVGDMFAELYKPGNIVIVTTNSYVDKHGCLVMGKGAAKELKERYMKLSGEDISLYFGHLITTGAKHLKEYGLLINPLEGVGIFQTKYHFKDNSDLELIKIATQKLIGYAKTPMRNHLTFHMNFPGIGYGHLDEGIVYPIIQELPDNVIIYKKGI